MQAANSLIRAGLKGEKPSAKRFGEQGEVKQDGAGWQEPPRAEPTQNTVGCRTRVAPGVKPQGCAKLLVVPEPPQHKVEVPGGDWEMSPDVFDPRRVTKSPPLRKTPAGLSCPG